jgi:hypothetical protein
MDETKAEEKAPKRGRSAWWVEILIAAAVVLVVVGIAIPAYNFAKISARRGESIADLHEIQLGIEHFAVDTGGYYPEYLIGGSAPRGDNPKHPFAQASDPLLRKGYLTAYPRNPFAVEQDVKAMQERYKDPFRPSTKESKFGDRFGEDYALMGQVLADFRYPKLPGQKMAHANGLYYYADTEYPFWDIWPTHSRPKPFLPGEFFYKSWGDLTFDNTKNAYPDKPIVPSLVYIYMLGLYGGPNDKGKDVFGTETNELNMNSWPPSEKPRNFTIPEWTRSTMTPTAKGDYLGSPYRLPVYEEGDQVAYGDPNGIPDAIIFVIVPGSDNPGSAL